MIRTSRFLFAIGAWMCWTACGAGVESSFHSDTNVVSVEPVETRNLKGHPLVVPAPGKITVLIFLAPHCGTCENMVADLDRYQRRLDRDRVSVIGVVLDANQEAAIQLQKKKQVSFPWTTDHESVLPILYRVRGVPLVFVLDEMGRITLSVDGAPGDSEKLLRHVRSLLEH